MNKSSTGISTSQSKFNASGEAGNPQKRVRSNLRLFVPSWVRDLIPLLKGLEMSVLLIYFSRSNREGLAWPSIGSLCRDVRRGERAVRRAKVRLIKLGLLERVEQGCRNGKFSSEIVKIATEWQTVKNCLTAEGRQAVSGGTKVVPLKVYPETVPAASAVSSKVVQSDMTSTADCASVRQGTSYKKNLPGEDGVACSRRSTPARLSKGERIRQAYERDIQEENFYDFIQKCDPEVGSSYVKHWREFKETFSEFNVLPSRTSASFALVILDKFAECCDRIRNGTLDRGLFLTKVIDEAVVGKVLYDPCFQELRKLLREKKNPGE